jgi:hypothetical protein
VSVCELARRIFVEREQIKRAQLSHREQVEPA